MQLLDGKKLSAEVKAEIKTAVEKIKAEGIDIMLSMDLSSSMLAQDFEPNRLAVSKKMAIEFSHLLKKEFKRSQPRAKKEAPRAEAA